MCVCVKIAAIITAIVAMPKVVIYFECLISILFAARTVSYTTDSGTGFTLFVKHTFLNLPSLGYIQRIRWRLVS